MVYEARVRTCAVCTVNNREEAVWSSYSPVALCKWIREASTEPAPGEEDAKKKQEKEEKVAPGVNHCRIIGILLFVVISLFSIVLALILGQIAV